VLQGVRFKQDLDPFIRAGIDLRRATVRTDGFAACLALMLPEETGEEE
jgi:hypothetical protein